MKVDSDKLSGFMTSLNVAIIFRLTVMPISALTGLVKVTSGGVVSAVVGGIELSGVGVTVELGSGLAYGFGALMGVAVALGLWGAEVDGAWHATAPTINNKEHTAVLFTRTF